MRLLRRGFAPLALITVLGGLLGVAGPAAGDTSADVPASQHVQLRPIGAPTWRPVGFQLFSAPIGTADSEYAEFGETMEALLPPPNHFRPRPRRGSRGGAPAAVRRRACQRRGRAGIPRARPVHVAGVLQRQRRLVGVDERSGPRHPGFLPGLPPRTRHPERTVPHPRVRVLHPSRERFSTLTDFDVPPLDAIDPPFDVDGHSHFPGLHRRQHRFRPPDSNPFGLYIWQFEMVDQSGAGWQIEAQFVVRH